MTAPVFLWHNLLDTETVTSSVAAATGFPVTNMYDDRLYTLFKMGSSNTELLIKTSSAGNQAVDYFSIQGHDLSQPAGSGAAVDILFQYSDNDSSWTTVTGLTTITPTTNRVIVRTFTSSSHKYWRLKINRAAAFIASIGQVQWGQRCESPYGVKVGFDPQAEDIVSQMNRSQTGNVLGALYSYGLRKAKIDLEFLTNTWVRGSSTNQFQYFWDNHARKMKPFLFLWYHDVSGTYEQDAIWCTVDPGSSVSRPLATQLASGYRHISFSVTGTREE
jgi:hypothetical protein